MSNTEISISIKATDQASSALKKLRKTTGKVSAAMKKDLESVSQKLDKIGKTALIAGGIMAAGLGVSVKQAADFETGMSNVSTLIDTNVESMEEMNQKVLDIASNVPVAIGDLTSALYDVRSAGINASSAMNVLKNSARLGVAGLGSTKEATDLVTSSLNAFNLKGQEANQVYDKIFKTVKAGKTTISALAQGFGSVAGTVASSGIKLDEYLASVAALTTTGLPAASAHTQLKASISGLTRETKESTALFNKLGAKNFKDLVEKSGGMVNAFAKIKEALKGNDGAILKLFGSTEAFNAVMGLTGNQAKAFKSALADMRTGANALDTAYGKKLKSLNSQLQLSNNNIQEMAIAFGTELAPAVTSFVKSISSVVKFINTMPKPIKSVIAISGALLAVSLITFGTIASVASGVISIMTALELVNNSTAVSFALNLGKGIVAATRAFIGFNAALLTNPITWVVIGVVALVAATVLLVKNWDKVTAAFKNAFNAAKSFFGAIGKSKDIKINASVNSKNSKSGIDSIPNAKSAGPMPKYDVGSSMITRTGKAIVHKGEKIIPANSRAGGNSYSIVFNPQVTINGNNTNIQSEVEKAMQRSFDKMMNQFKSQNSRLAY